MFDLPDVIPHKLAVVYHEKDKILFENRGTQVYEGEVKCSDSLFRRYLFYKATVENLQRDVIGIVGVMLDITELKYNQDMLDEKNKLLEKLSYADFLTNLYNRRKFDDIFPWTLKIANRYDFILNFIILDVDNFKMYNDTYGHQKGDIVLKKISDVLFNILGRSDDYAFRLGGEEFGVLYHSIDEDKALLYANKIKNDIEQLNVEHKYNEKFGILTVSMGLITIKTKNNDILCI